METSVISETCASRVARCREAVGISPAELSRRAGLSRSQVSRIESGQMPRPPAETLSAIARVLGTTSDYLLTGDCPDPDSDLPADLRAQIAALSHKAPELGALVGQLVSQGNRLPDTAEGRAAFVEAIRVATIYLKGIASEQEST